MKHTKHNALAAALAMLGAMGAVGSVAAAGPSADLKVVGTIKAPVCTVGLSDLGEADFGPIPRSTLKDNTSVALGAKDLDLTVQCDHSTLLMIKVADTKAASRPTGGMNITFDGSSIAGSNTVYYPANLLGLGMSHNDTVIGGYVLAFGKPSVDGTPATYISANNDGAVSYDTYSADVLYFHDTAYMYFGASDATANMKLPGEKHEFPIAVAASLERSGLIPADQDIDLSGTATLEVVYL